MLRCLTSNVAVKLPPFKQFAGQQSPKELDGRHACLMVVDEQQAQRYTQLQYYLMC